VEGVTDGESENRDCDEVICAGWGEPGGQWTEWGWRNEEGSWFQGEVMHIWNSGWWFVMTKIWLECWFVCLRQFLPYIVSYGIVCEISLFWIFWC